MSLSERQINDRRRWKAEGFPYDYYLPDDTPECQYCLTEKQAEILRGMLQPLAWKTRWWSDSDAEIDQDTIEAYRDDIIRRLMMACCDTEFGVIFRWTEDGVLQKSSDGGATWEDAPEDDPRNSSPVFPPVAGDPSPDKKCIAANSVKTLIKEQVGDQLTDDMSRYTLGQVISDWVNTLLQSSNPFDAIIQIVTNQILALVIATLRPALTDDVYNELECCVYCNMADDLSFSDAQWTAVRTCITDNISGIAGVFLEHLIYLIGKVGLTNLARSQAATDGDCSECCPSCIGLFQLGIPNPNLGDTMVAVGTLVDSGDDWWTIASVDRGDGQQVIWVSAIDGNSCCNMLRETVGAVSPHTITFFTDCGTVAQYSNNVENDLLPNPQCATSIGMQMDPGTNWQIKFTFLGGC